MKKEMNLKSRRKWIMGGLAAFASVALLTTGFAVWVVGVQQTSKNGSVQVNVDTAENRNVEFYATLSDSTIRLAEPANVTTGFVKAEQIEEGTKRDFSITFSEFKIVTGSDVQYTKVKFSLVTKLTKDEGAEDGITYVDNKVDATGTKLDSKLTTGRPSEGATYFDLAVTEFVIPEKNDNAKGSDGYLTCKKTNSGYEYTLDSTKMTLEMFKWGTFFNSESPCTFYNKVFADKATQTAANAQAVQDETTIMHNKYEAEKTKIALHMELE